MRWPRPTHPWRLPWGAGRAEESGEWLIETPLRRMAAGLGLAAMGALIIVWWRVDPNDFWDGRRPLVALISAPLSLGVGLYLFLHNLLRWLRGDDLREDKSLIDPPV